ncbi:MAG TPA: PLP-dependent aspartate aminotransferase family protein [Acidobacteriaceae bacterium]|jgi:cystathionine beta-lyase/cystathionine gamma-synthase|nr:PLP-dependent aspartate aminotransferase family protein [Acidobacteriaceae bacterium]
MTTPSHGFSTRAIHDGQEPDPRTGAVNVPIYLTSTYELQGIEKHRGWEYSRVSNPTRDALETNLASLEGGATAHVFASGMAAIGALVTMLNAGDHVICGDNVYGGTTRLFSQVITRHGIEFSYVDTSNAENVRQVLRPTTKLVHIETPTNPLMALTDIRAVADICHERGVPMSVDNTFMSPYFQRPLELGADIAMHSTTKFLNGHSDGLGGVLVTNSDAHAEQFRFVQKCTGGILSPFESWLILRGVKTLAVRMRQHDENGRQVAAFLSKHPKVSKVLYPGLATHPQHELAKRQMDGFGSMIAFEVGSRANADKLLQRVRVITNGESLGGVESLISHSATTTHAALSREERERIGITEGLVRISVGIEDAADILGDLDQALAAV